MNKKNILNIILAFLSTLSISFYLKTNFYNIFIIIMFFGLLYFYSKVNKNIDKKARLYSTILSIFFSLVLSVGNIVIDNLAIKDIGYLSINNIIKIILMIIGFIPLLYKLFKLLFLNINKLNIIDQTRKDKINFKKFILIFIMIFAGWFILFLRFFPAIMTPDSHYVIHNVVNGILSDHHTFGHTWFFGTFYYLGKLIFSSTYGGIALYTVVQMIIMDLMFCYAITYFYNIKVKKNIIYMLTLFITLNPLFSHYSVTLWRDVLFGMSFLTIFICLYKYLNNKIKIFDIIIFTISLLFLLFFRNNGIYVLIFMAPFIILIGNKKIFKSIYFVLIILIYFIIKGPIFNHFNIEKGLEREAYSIPIQQISRVIASKKIDKESLEILDDLYDIKRAKKEYDPVISDKMKETIDETYLKENKGKFLGTWFKLLKKYPLLYFEAYFTQTLGYWYPDVEYWATAGESISIFDRDIHTKPILPKSINNLIDKTTSRKIPFSIFIWSIGLNIAILIITTFITIYKKGNKYILCFIPLYALWFTILIATPVYAELRYIFGLFCTIPFIIFTPFLKE